LFGCSNRYQTKGIINNVNINLQLLMWNLIDELKEKVRVDYLQIFKLSKNSEGKIVIEHSQEVPKYKAVYEINIDMNDTELPMKVYVIDEKSYSIMLLAEEY